MKEDAIMELIGLKEDLALAANEIKERAKTSEYWRGCHDAMITISTEIENQVKEQISGYVKGYFNLILKDVSRCSDEKCPKSSSCKRFLQMEIDKENGEEYSVVSDFKGSENNGVCDYYINIGNNEQEVSEEVR